MHTLGRSTLVHLVTAVALVLIAGRATACETEAIIPGLFRSSYSGPRPVLIPRFNPALGTLQSVRLEVMPEFSGTAGGVSGAWSGAHGWSIEFSGVIRLSAPSFAPIDYPYFFSRSGTVFQTGTPIFETFGPATLAATPPTITTNLAPYIGVGNVSASLSWPTYVCEVFWVHGGTEECSRDLGSIDGRVVYTYTPTTPCPADLTTTATPGAPGYGVSNCVLDNEDFFYYLAEFAAGNLGVADLTGSAVPGSPGYGVPNGILNNEDFFFYLTLFAAGC